MIEDYNLFKKRLEYFLIIFIILCIIIVITYMVYPDVYFLLNNFLNVFGNVIIGIWDFFKYLVDILVSDYSNLLGAITLVSVVLSFFYLGYFFLTESFLKN